MSFIRELPILIHEQTRNHAYPVDRNTLMLRLLTEPIPNLSCSVVCWNRYTQNEESVEPVVLDCYARDRRFSYYEAEIVRLETSRYLRYFFIVSYRDEAYYLTSYGVNQTEPKAGFFEYLCTNDKDVFSPPVWARNAVFYQIFPERFCNGDDMLNPSFVEPWGGLPTEKNFFGGDLQGIIRNLNHIIEMGINVLYLTPIFHAPSNHKYDTIDYFRIDPHFGTLDDLKNLVSLCHENNIRVILDGVFNHCGYYSEQFQDFLKNEKESRYADWFYAGEFPLTIDPLNYDCVGYYKWMPKLRFDSREVREYFLRIGEYWIEEADIDGWRLDVADEVDYTFWQEFRKRIKSIKNDALLIGETWGDGRNLLEGDQMDSVMNYLFRDAVLDFIARDNIDACEFDNRIQRMFGIYKRMVLPSLYNPLGSHDTPRIFTECAENTEKLTLAVVLQMTFTGAPAIYYGDEFGMTGDNDPGCRQTMAWDNPNHLILSLYRKLIDIRKEHKPLTCGIHRTLYCSEGVYAFVRQHGDENVYVIVNNMNQQLQLLLPVLDASDFGFKSLVGERTYVCSELIPETLNVDLLSCNGCVEIELSSFCFEIFRKRW